MGNGEGRMIGGGAGGRVWMRCVNEDSTSTDLVGGVGVAVVGFLERR